MKELQIKRSSSLAIWAWTLSCSHSQIYAVDFDICMKFELHYDVVVTLSAPSITISIHVVLMLYVGKSAYVEHHVGS